jgi:hypothetical protein
MFSVDLESGLGSLHRVDVCGSADVSKVRAVLFFRIEEYGERERQRSMKIEED